MGDYSVMGKVYSSQYNEFVNKLTTEQEKENKTLLFERHLINEIEKWVCKNDMCGGNVEERQKNLQIIEKGEQIPYIYAVADLQLAFDNDQLMSLLEQRANFLMAGKFEKANEVEVKMTALKKEKYDVLTTPKNFFCTFHYEYAYKQAIFTNKF